MNPVVYFRQGDWSEADEYEACCSAMPTFQNRTSIPTNSLVVPRYSMLPFPQELERDVSALKGRLINPLSEHKYVADIRNWVTDLEGLTPRTWTNWTNLPLGMSFVVKGATNSRKHEWNKRMFANTREDVPRVAGSLLNDALIYEQGLVVREYVPLVRFGEGINGLPITNEWRIFVLNQQIMASGYYWANFSEYIPEDNQIPKEAEVLAQEVIRRVGKQITFYVIDVACSLSRGWIVIELNDGTQSGLSTINPVMFYRTLSKRLNELCY